MTTKRMAGLLVLWLATSCTSKELPASYALMAEGVDDEKVYLVLQGPRPTKDLYALVERGSVRFFVDRQVEPAATGAVKVQLESGPAPDQYRISVVYRRTAGSPGTAVFLDGRSLGQWNTTPTHDGPMKSWEK